MTLVANTLESSLLKDLTTWKIGGPTQVFKPQTIEQLQDFLQSYKGQICVIGYGSNLLAPSDGFNGACIVLKKNFSKYKISGSTITAQAGLSCPKLAKIASQMGYDSLNFLVGIPGSLGGAVVMNAGAHGHSLMQSVSQITMLDNIGRKWTFSRQELTWRYRKTFLPIEGVVTSVTLDLRGSFPLSLKEVMNYRSKTQPLSLPSCGSFFKNPSPDYPAGKLIEELGFKGWAFKGLRVSAKHANFIINQEEGSSQDILDITKIIQQKAFLTTGLILEPEYQLLKPLWI